MSEAFGGPASTRELRSYPSSVPTLLDPSSDTLVGTFAGLGSICPIGRAAPAALERLQKFAFMLQNRVLCHPKVSRRLWKSIKPVCPLKSKFL